ncbi:unnamed protein product [Ectocarpus sp. 12 AP-2014]
MNQRRQRRKATLQSQRSQDVGNSANSRRPSPKYSETGSGAFSTPVARISKWPKNVFFASDFIADKAAAAACRKRSTVKSSRGAAPRCRRNAGEGKKMGRGSRAMGEEAPVALTKKNSSTIVFRASGGGGTFQQHGVRSCEDGEGRTDASVAGDEEAFFLEESASALLLLHSRFFGGARHEEDVVCSLCTLCREAGWMGNPLGVCPGLDPLVVEEVVMERLRRKHHSDLAWQRHNNNSGGSSRPSQHYENVGISFEDFYQILADVAGLVYPREAQEERRRAKPGRAMHRMLTEGVLPLAEDNQPRRWSPRSEMLFGRPALAALRMQRDTLHELYCTYNKDTRTRDGASGLNRNQFLKASIGMLTDLGVSPMSVTEQHAASVFDDIIRNGLPVTGPSIGRRRSWGEGVIHEASDRGDYCLMAGERYNGLSSSSRKPGGGRLCWSLFLEAMAALAVGAVKNGQSVSPRWRRNGKPAFGSHRWERVDGGDGSIREPTHAANELPPSWSVEDHSPKLRVSNRSKGTRETSEKRCDRPSGHRRAKGKPGTDRQATRAPGHGMAEAVAGANHPLPYGRGFYHDSRKGMELMPTLIEADITHDQASSPLRSRHSPSEQQQGTARQDEKRNRSVEPAPDTRPSRFDTATTGLGWGHATEKARHSEGTDSEGRRRLYEQSRGKTERGLVQQSRPPDNRVTQGAPSTDKRHGVDSLLPRSRQTTTGMAARASVDAEQSRARARYKSKSRENTKRNATGNATSHGGAHPDELYHPRSSTDDDAAINKGPTSRPVLARREEEEFRASADMSGGVRGRSPVSSEAIWEGSPTASAAGALLHAVAADGREEVVAGSRRSDPGPARRKSSATSSVMSVGLKAKGGAGSSEEAPGDSRSRLSMIATADSAEGSWDKVADVQTATVNVPYPTKVVNTKDVAALSPAPCHGGPPSLAVSAASGGCSARTCRVAVDLGLPSPDVERGEGTADVILRPDPGKHSAHHVAPRERLCASVGGAEGTYCSVGRIKSAVGRGGGEKSKALRGIDTYDDRLKGVGRAARADHITMDLEAAGCSVGLFEELLEPRVVAAYSR